MNEALKSQIKSHAITAVCGAFAGMLLLAHVFGFNSPSTTEKIASTRANESVISALTPVCVDTFMHQPDAASSLVALQKETSSYKRTDFIDKLLVPGVKEMHYDLKNACSDALYKYKPQAAALKQ
jgi:hypothetical protein